MATMREINEARANRMQSGLYGTPRTDAQKQRSYGQMSDADAAQRDAVGREQYRQNLVNQIPTPASSAPKPSALAAAAPPVSDSYPDEAARALRQPARGVSPTSPQATQQRAVQGAPGVTRYDNVNGLRSPLYTNLPGAQAMDQMRGGSVSAISGPTTDELLARAERMRSIREGNTALRDNLNFNAGGVLGRQYSQDEVIKNMSTSRSRSDRAAALGYYQGQNRNATELQGKKFDAQAAATADQLRAKAALELADKQGQWGMARTGLEAAGAYERSKIQADQRGIAAEMAGLYRILNNAEAPEIDRIQAERRLMELQYGAPEQELADGGLVYGMDDYQSAVGYARGGEVQGYGQVPSAAQALPQVNEYREYGLGAKALGLPAIPFDQFLTMRQGAQQVAQAPGPVQPMTAMGFANGGKIPDPNDVSGKMVVDTDPNAPTDSIPAVVDGQMPAKLDSGEFVIPEDVVKFFGTDKLNKMIAQARQGQQAAGE